MPLESIPGPVLYLLLDNDMPFHVHKSTVDVFKFKPENHSINTPIIIQGPDRDREVGKSATTSHNALEN